MKIVTFNIRCDFQQDGGNSFIYRRDYIKECIRRERPDVIGFQEVLPHVVKWLRENLEEYTVVGCGREKNFSDEHMILACRRDSIQVMGLSTFWLSPTPEIPGSRYEQQSICPRNCCEALLREDGSGLLFRVFATHLDHEFAYARREGIKLILERMGQNETGNLYPSILLGDFNAQPDDPELAPLRSHPAHRDVTSNSGATYHDYGKAASKIDYIVVSPEFDCHTVKLWKDCINGIYLSDHYPVEAELIIRE